MAKHFMLNGQKPIKVDDPTKWAERWLQGVGQEILLFK